MVQLVTFSRAFNHIVWFPQQVELSCRHTTSTCQFITGGSVSGGSHVTACHVMTTEQTPSTEEDCEMRLKALGKS